MDGEDPESLHSVQGFKSFHPPNLANQAKACQVKNAERKQHFTQVEDGAAQQLLSESFIVK